MAIPWSDRGKRICPTCCGSGRVPAWHGHKLAPEEASAFGGYKPCPDCSHEDDAKPLAKKDTGGK